MRMNIKINNLFGKINYDLILDSKLNILIGENGCGKTTILKIIACIINHDFISLSKILFDKIEVSFENFNILINYEDLKQHPITKNPEFRFYLNEIIQNKYLSFDEFYNSILEISIKQNDYLIEINNDTEYIENMDKYLNDDNHLFMIDNFVEKMSIWKCLYGSKKYFENLYNIIYNVNTGYKYFAEFNSYIDINGAYNTNFNDSTMKILNNFMPEKEFLLDNNMLIIKDKDTNAILDYDVLSSGEKKIIQIASMINNSDENKIILLDEPELSLSIYWQRELINTLLNYCDCYIIILASQSSNLITEDEIEYLVPVFSDCE